PGRHRAGAQRPPRCHCPSPARGERRSYSLPRSRGRAGWGSLSIATPIRAARGAQLSARGWQQEAALRMLCKNLEQEVAERPEELVVYGGTGMDDRAWPSFPAVL